MEKRYGVTTTAANHNCIVAGGYSFISLSSKAAADDLRATEYAQARFAIRSISESYLARTAIPR